MRVERTLQNRLRQVRQTTENRKMSGRKMIPETRLVFIFLPGIFLLEHRALYDCEIDSCLLKTKLT
jgi:hypothetical protein